MKVLIFEHLCGGAMAGPVGDDTSTELYLSGKAMWRAAVRDFVAAGCAVVTTVDERFAHEAPDEARVHVVVVDRADRVEAQVVALADECDAVLVIAPEEEGTLARWARLLQGRNARWLGCDVAAIELCGDKLRLARHWHAHGIATPPTLSFSEFRDGVASERQGTAKRVVKPRFGAGCECTRIIVGPDDTDADDEQTPFLVQPYVEGRSASVSFIVRGSDTIALPAGAQHVSANADGTLEYRGGSLPLDNELAQRATAIAQRAIACVSGLNGYVGVDVILGHEASEDRAIEINPRLTMSFLGLSAMGEGDMAGMMLELPGSSGALQWANGGVSFDVDGQVRAHDLTPMERPV